MTELEALVRLNLSGVVGSALLRRLREHLDLARLDRVTETALRRIPGLGPRTARAIARAPHPGPEIERAARLGIDILPCSSPAFPGSLRTVYDHPVVLYRRGRPVEADASAIGVVGTRDCTDYGRRQADRFAHDLARLGLTIVSGLARGIDTAAHRGALRAKDGRTVAVLGSGLRRAYPPENARLLEEICGRGAAYSEFPLDFPPEPLNFPRRNRILSGLCLGVLVVEAGDRSGALLTADWALEQNREVFCLPGSVENPMSRGGHRLIRQGATLVETPEDLLEAFPAFASLLPPAVPVTPLERAVHRVLADRPLPPEAVAEAGRLPLSAVERVLESLAAKGAARRKPDGTYLRAVRGDTMSGRVRP
ncbi:MAG TPA: DNA-processing protein DprA [Planctomycetota bacterium]|nr:DNA-processing protein DprA [Planctomycetota bacterium]